MPFQLVVGTMGGGKSYYGAEIALKCWEQGGVVMSNMDWNEDALDEINPLFLREQHRKLPENVLDWHKVFIGGAEGAENILLVDESAMIFHTWDAAESRKRNRGLFDVLVMSRKLGLDVYFISQHGDNVDSALRRMAQTEIKCVNVKKQIPVLGPWLAKAKGDFLRITRNPERRQELTREYVRFRQRVGDIYQTDALRGLASKIERSATRKEQKTKAPFWLKATAVGIVVAFFGGLVQLKGTWDAMHGEKPGKPADGQQTGQAGTVHSASGQQVPPGQMVSSVRVGQAPPLLTPFGPASGHKEEWIEWDDVDERIIVSVTRYGQRVAVWTLGGQKFTVGSRIEGETIESLQSVGDEWFAKGKTGRVFYLRRRTYRERREEEEWMKTQAAALRAGRASGAPVPPAAQQPMTTGPL